MISNHFKSIDAEHHPGKQHLRVALKNFHVDGLHGTHQCIVFPALGNTLGTLRDLFEERALEKTLLQTILFVIVTALDFMHQAGVVHKGPILSPCNRSTLADMQARPFSEQHPGRNRRSHRIKGRERRARKPIASQGIVDCTNYLSYTMPASYDPPVITDFGAARLGDPGQKHMGDAMPGIFRAPDIIAGMGWDSQIDIWSVGVMVRINRAFIPSWC